MRAGCSDTLAQKKGTAMNDLSEVMWLALLVTVSVIGAALLIVSVIVPHHLVGKP